MISAWLIDVDYVTVNEKAVIRLWCKDDNGVFVAYDPNFKPYFYVIGLDESDIKNAVIRDKKVITPESYEIVKLKSLGKSVEAFKVYAKHPQHVPKLREYFRSIGGDVREADIPFAYRYLIDKDLACMDGIIIEGKEKEGKLRSYEVEHVERDKRIGFPDLKIMAFDCEMLASQGMPDAEKDPIIVISIKYRDEDELILTGKERDILLKFVKFIKDYDPDVIVGYNQDAFDWPYIKKRAEKWKIPLEIGRDGSELSFRGGRPKIVGRLNVDLYDIALKISDVKVKKLENVAEYLGKRIELADIEAKDIYKYWNRGEKDRVLNYARQDVIHTYLIAQELLPMHYELSKMIRIPLDDVTRIGRGKQVDWLLLSEAHRIGEIAPNPPEFAETYEGAFVLEPVRGLHENVACLDFTSMYPSIMITFNISPDTLGCEDDCFTAPEVGHKFRKKPDGFFRRILRMLIEKRKAIKEEMKKYSYDSPEYKLLDIKQQTLKILTNSILPNEWLPIIDNGEIRFVRIGEFIDERMKTGNVKKIGDSEVLEVKGIEVFSFNRDEKTSQIKPVKALIRHKYKGKVYEIELESGRKVKVTEGHSLFTVKNGEIVEITGKEIKEGSLIVVPKRIHIDEEEITLNIPKLLSKLPLDKTKDIVLTFPVNGRKNFFKGMLRTLRWIFGEEDKKIRTINRYLSHLKELGLIRMNSKSFEVTNWESLRHYKLFYELLVKKAKYNPNKREYVIRFNDLRDIIGLIPDTELKAWKVGTINGFKMQSVIRIDEDFGKLLGYYVSEGYSRVQKKSYTVRLYNRDQKVLDEMYRLAEKFFGRVRRTKNYVEISKKIAYLIFNTLCGSKAGDKRIPSEIFKSPKDVRLAFLKCYFIGDGDVHPSKRLRLSTKSELLANQLVLLLNSLGISAVKLGYDSGVYRIYINEEVEFLNLKRERNSYYSNVIPKEVLTDVFGVKFQKNMSFNRFRELLYNDEKAKAIEWIINGDLVLDRVKNVKEEEYDGYVYDLSVEDNENFLVGFGLVYAHNSFYGYTGWDAARWYCRQCAEATTAWGRYFIKKSMTIAKNLGFEVLYGDTDSIFIKKKNVNLNKLKSEVEKLIEKLSKELPIQIEVDEYFKTIFFVEKKRYAGLTEDGRLIVKGLEIRRGDWCELAKKVQKEVIEIILKKKDPEKAAKFVKDVIKNIKFGGVKLEDLVIYKSLTKKPDKYESMQAHVKAAIRAMEMGIVYAVGSKVGYVVVKGSGNIGDRAYPVDLIDDFDGENLKIRTKDGYETKKIDKDYYINHQVIPSVLRILEMFGYTEASLKGVSQMSLDEFF